MASTMTEYHKKKAKIFDYLGGSCVRCESTDGLHIDHIDHLSKSFTISNNWGLSWDKLKDELDKCQLLCAKCHMDKTLAEGSLAKGWTNQPRQKHGTVWSYAKYGCRCADCKRARSLASTKERKRKQGVV